MLDTNRKSTATLHFTMSDIERSKSGLFRFRRIIIFQGAELGGFLYTRFVMVGLQQTMHMHILRRLAYVVQS